MLIIRRPSSGSSAVLKTTVMTLLLIGAGAAGAQPPDVYAEPAAKPPVTKPSTDSKVEFHGLICKPNGTEDGFDCADEAMPATIVPIPSRLKEPRQQDGPVSG